MMGCFERYATKMYFRDTRLQVPVSLDEAIQPNVHDQANQFINVGRNVLDNFDIFAART